jgi:hypothetical protein
MEAVHQTLRKQLSDSNGEIKPAKVSRRGQQTRAGKVRLLDRESLDRRSAVFKVFDRLVSAIHVDMGGRDQLSAIELALIEAYAGAAVTLNHLNTQILAGAEIDSAMVAMHAQAISAMVRVASRLGTARRAKDVTGVTLGEVIRADQAAERERLARHDGVVQEAP